MKKINYLALAILCVLGFSLRAQTFKNKKDGGFTFTTVKDIDATDVANQNQSSTCWSFSSLSFFESELLRMGKGRYNLSEMYVVRKAYEDKAEKYIRMHGEINLGPGGSFHDMLYVWKKYGAMPQMAYPVRPSEPGDTLPVHHELDEMVKSTADIIIKTKNGSKLSPFWKEVINGILDAYLGKLPAEFTYQGKTYTPRSFADATGLNPNDYVAVTSFTHHPFYTQFALEIPDNWQWGQFYNISLDEMRQVMDNALNNGYSVAWAADVSEKGFAWKNGIAIVPETPWENMTKAQKDTIFNGPSKQMVITEEVRQKAFDNYETQDDHGMHITGIVKDQAGNKYYKVKNSWGTMSNECGGYLYASEAYVLYKTTNILVHKDAIPKEIAKKMGIIK